MGQTWGRGDDLTLGELIEARLAGDPDGPFLEVQGRAGTAAELVAEADRFAGALAALGVRPGDRVATLCENTPEQVVALLGGVRAGIVSVPINTAFKGEYLRHQLRDSGARVLVVDGGLLDRARHVADDLDDLAHVVVVGDPVEPTPGTTWHRWEEVLTDPPGATARNRPEDLAVFIYTGGTTGPSKGCMLSHHYVATVAAQIARTWGRRPDDVVWTPLPLFHLNALAVAVVGTMLVGGSAVVDRRFSVSGFWPAVNRAGATMASTLGSMVALLAADEDRPEMPRSGAPEANRTLRFISGAPLSPALIDRWVERFGIRPFDAGYGTTEACLLSWLPPGRENRPHASGVVNDEYWDVRIFDDTDRDLGRNRRGEIVARPRRANVMFDGYWGRPADTLACLRNLWFHTGDIGMIDDDGYVYFLDRKADYLRRRGENVSSYELEQAFQRHPDLADLAVHAVPSPMGEDDIKLTAVRRPGSALTEEALYRWAVDEVPFFALPRYIEFRADLPRSDMGKVLKGRLRDDGVTATTWDAEASGVEVERR
jgi:crotonobetaine/carnitine-CoA ligase